MPGALRVKRVLDAALEGLSAEGVQYDIFFPADNTDWCATITTPDRRAVEVCITPIAGLSDADAADQFRKQLQEALGSS